MLRRYAALCMPAAPPQRKSPILATDERGPIELKPSIERRVVLGSKCARADRSPDRSYLEEAVRSEGHKPARTEQSAAPCPDAVPDTLVRTPVVVAPIEKPTRR